MADATTKRVIEIDVKTSGDALRSIKAMQTSLGGLEKSITSVTGFLQQFAVGFAAAFTVGGVVSSIKATIKAMDDARDSAQAMGISVTTLSEWSYAAEMSGSNAETLSAGVRGLSKTMEEMSGKGNKATKALERFGVEAADDVDTALTKIAEGVSKMPDGFEKTALALDIFGKSGAKLIPLLNEGAEGVQKLKDEAAALGLVLDDTTSKAAQQFGDDLDKIAAKAEGAAIQLARGLLPALSDIAEEWARVNRGTTVFTEIGQYLGEVLIRLHTLFVNVAAGVTIAAQAIYGFIVGSQQFMNKEFKQAGDTFVQTWNKINETAAIAAERIKRVQDNFDPKKWATSGQVLLDSIDSFVERTTPRDRPKDDDGKDKVDKDVQALERLIKSSREAALAISELTHVRQLEYQVASGQIKVSTEKEKALYKEAKAAAGILDLKERQVAAEKEDIRLGKEQDEAAKKEIKRIDDIRNKYLDMADATREVTRQQNELTEAIKHTTDEETLKKLEKASLMLRQDFTVALTFGKTKAKDLDDSLKDLGETLKQEIEGYSADAAAALVDFATTGKQSVADMVTSILADLAKLAVKTALDPVFKEFASFVGDLAKAKPNAHGNVFGHSGVQAFASGGVVNGPTFFGMAGGGTGLMGEAGPEAVVPLRRTSGGDLGVQASPVNVTVVNNNGSDIKTEETKGAMGERQLLIMVNAAVEEGIGRGRFDRVMSTTYGVSRRGK